MLQVLLDGVKGLAVNHRADIGRQLGRMAHYQFLRGALTDCSYEK